MEQEFEAARRFVTEVDRKFIVLFAPDHYPGFFAENMPPFCIGTAAEGLGDYGGKTGPIRPGGIRAGVLMHVLADDLDVATSRRMGLDHGAVQPREILFGSHDTIPVIPAFVNGVAPTLSPMRRASARADSWGHLRNGGCIAGLPVAGASLAG